MISAGLRNDCAASSPTASCSWTISTEAAMRPWIWRRHSNAFFLIVFLSFACFACLPPACGVVFISRQPMQPRLHALFIRRIYGGCERV